VEELAMGATGHEAAERFCCVLGEAVIKVWGGLPHDLQTRLFEEAVTSRELGMRPQLAIFLHDRHPRTSAARRARAIPEPDSLGG
jgi:hypothetical protein